ncbi:MAG: hypothetical protein SFY81_10435 [Verrucomicrobiota bacterium]|nr:hypothetical protein [Verrucomicrobiota bacterium]
MFSLDAMILILRKCAIVLSLLLFLAGCDKNKKSSSTITPQHSGTNSIFNWTAYPTVTRMRLGTLSCQLLPRSVIPITAPVQGNLRLYVSTPQTNLPANFLWAEFEPDIYAAEAESLENARRKLDERERLQAELEIPRQRLQLERQIEEMQRQVALLRLLSTNQELADLALSIPGQTGGSLRPDALLKAETELRLLNQSMAYLQETNFSVLGLDIPTMRTELQRRKLEFERRQNQARLKMPFDGQLTVSLSLTEGVSEYIVTGNQEVGVARDLSVIRARVVFPNPAWSSLPPERLFAVMRLQSGIQLEARFAYQKVERVQNREESVYYFQFPTDKSAQAARFIGTDISCEIYYTLPEPAQVIPKVHLVVHNPVAFKGRTWMQGLETAFPGSRVIAEGQIEVAIVKGGNN